MLVNYDKKRLKLLNLKSKAQNANQEWKVKQIEMKLLELDKKYKPTFLWDSSNGAYKKERKES